MSTTIPGLAATESLKILVSFDSEWHIGTGGGRQGTVDRVVLRENNVPFVPAKSLWGVWRDATEQLALGLDGGAPGAWCDLTEWVFGSQPAMSEDEVSAAPRPAAITLEPAAFPRAQRQFLAHPMVSSSVTMIRPGVKINPSTGTAEPDHLTMTEVVRRGAQLESTLTANVDLPPVAVALLVAGASRINSIGGKRRRGLGKCSVTASLGAAQQTLAVEDVVETLRQFSERDPLEAVSTRPVVEALADAGATGVGHGDGDVEWKQIRVAITAVSPVLLADRVVGNAVTSRDRIPGASVVSLLQSHSDVPLFDFLANGELSVGDALVTDTDGEQMLPAPRSLGISKSEKDTGTLKDLFSPDPGPVKKIGAHCSVSIDSSAVLRIAEPHTRVDMHNRIDDKSQHAGGSDGSLFTYEVHLPGSKWSSTVWVSRRAFEQLRPAFDGLNGPARIGRSRKDDYGRVRVDLSEVEIIDKAGSVASQFDVLLTSESLIRDEALRLDPTPNGFVRTLCRKLEESGQPGLDLVDQHARSGRIESWHQRWGLPRPTLVGLSAGSVIRLMPQGPIDLRVIQQLGSVGIGDRTGEGFGRFVVDPQILTATDSPAWVSRPTLEVQTSGVADSDLPDIPDDGFCRVVAEEALISTARTRAEHGDWDAGTGLLQAKRLSNSQLGALRSVLLANNWQVRLQSWLDGVERTASRANQWDEGLRNRLRAVADKPESAMADFDAWPSDLRGQVAPRAVPVALGEVLRLLQKKEEKKSLRSKASSGHAEQEG